MKRPSKRITPGSGNIFLDLGFPPHEAAVMLLRCELAEALRKWMAREGLKVSMAGILFYGNPALICRLIQ